MRKRREREISEKPEEGNEIGEGEKGFFACYLLCSLSPRHKGHTYIGFTINPCRRIRQHNGEITCGAWRTKRKRPWEMILCIYGFPTNVSALQFEWAWQHPTESLAVRKAAASFKSLSGIANKIKLAYTMLNLPVWQSLNLTVNFFSTKYKKHSAGCPSLPGHMKVQVCPMDELPCYMGGVWPLNDDEDENEDGVMQDKEMDIPVNDITKFRCSIENTAYEEPGCIEHDGFRQPMEPLTPREDHRVPLCVRDCSITSSLDTVETVEDGDPFGVTGDGSSGLGQSTKQPQPQTPKAADNDRPPPPTNSLLFPPEVEVINVSTPLSDYIVRSCRKKKKSSTVFPEFIDLTKSPIFIQL